MNFFPRIALLTTALFELPHFSNAQKEVEIQKRERLYDRKTSHPTGERCPAARTFDPPRRCGEYKQCSMLGCQQWARISNPKKLNHKLIFQC